MCRKNVRCIAFSTRNLRERNRERERERERGWSKIYVVNSARGDVWFCVTGLNLKLILPHNESLHNLERQIHRWQCFCQIMYHHVAVAGSPHRFLSLFYFFTELLFYLPIPPSGSSQWGRKQSQPIESFSQSLSL